MNFDAMSPRERHEFFKTAAEIPFGCLPRAALMSIDSVVKGSRSIDKVKFLRFAAPEDEAFLAVESLSENQNGDHLAIFSTSNPCWKNLY